MINYPSLSTLICLRCQRIIFIELVVKFFMLNVIFELLFITDTVLLLFQTVVGCGVVKELLVDGNE